MAVLLLFCSLWAYTDDISAHGQRASNAEKIKHGFGTGAANKKAVHGLARCLPRAGAAGRSILNTRDEAWSYRRMVFNQAVQLFSCWSDSFVFVGQLFPGPVVSWDEHFQIVLKT